METTKIKRVQFESAKGTIFKSNDVVATILWDSPFQGNWVSRVPLDKLVVIGEASPEQLALIEKVAATYDTWETDALQTKYLAEKGFNPGVFPHRDWIEDTRTFPKIPSKPRHQQEQWWRRKKEQNEKEEVGGEGDSPGATPGYWMQSPTTFNAMPAGNTISVTMEFMKEGLRAVVTWDKEDLPGGLNEEQTLTKIVEFLERNVPQAMASFKNVSVDEVDIINRTITVKVAK